MDFQRALLTVKKEAERALLRFFDEKRTGAKQVDNNLLPLVDQVADFTLRGGKRMRAFLCWLGYISMPNDQCQMIPVEETTQHTYLDTRHATLLSAMMALELFHSFALIHDDVMDEDTVRRGGPTVHEHFKLKAQSSKRKTLNTKHFGESMAILAGDLALAWADELMGSVCFYTPDVKAISYTSGVRGKKAWELYRHMKEEVIYGQTMDVMIQAAAFSTPDVDAPDTSGVTRDKINEFKTAWYSVVRPLQIGASLSGADERYLRALAGFGVPVGKLFQLKDDAMDGDVDEAMFQRESKRLIIEATAALEKLTVADQIKPFFADLIAFVINRRL